MADQRRSVRWTGLAVSVVILAEGASARNALGYRKEGRYICCFRPQNVEYTTCKAELISLEVYR
jgi:hypothetical protein